MNAFITQLIEEGYILSENCSESSSFVELQKRTPEEDGVTISYHCNLSIMSRSGQVQECTYSTTNDYNITRHIKAQKHHKWKSNEGLEVITRRVHKNKGKEASI